MPRIERCCLDAEAETPETINERSHFRAIHFRLSRDHTMIRPAKKRIVAELLEDRRNLTDSDTNASRSSRDELNNRLFFPPLSGRQYYQTQAVKELNISAVQGAVLGALARDIKAGMSFSSLYAYLSVSRQNLDAVLTRLEKLG